jgi:hypothetical protein
MSKRDPESNSNSDPDCNTKAYADTETSPESPAPPDADTVMRLTEKVGCLGFAPVQAGKSTRVCIC